MKTHLLSGCVAVILNCTFETTMYANFALFERHTDTIQAAGQTVVDQSATYEAIFLLPSSHPHGGNIFNEWTSGQEDKMLAVSRNEIFGDNYEGTAPYGGLMLLYGTVTVSVDAWHHIAMVTDANEDRMYLDGKLIASQPRFAPIQNGTGLAQIGAIFRTSGSGSGVRGFVGVLDSLRISKTARYTGLSFTPPSGDLSSDADTLLLYNFNDSPTASTVNDGGPLHRTGTLGVGFTGATAPKIIESLNELSPTSGTDIIIDPRATYLRVNGDRARNSIPIALASLGIQAGDSIILEKIGDCNFTANYESSADNVMPKIAGVFSSSAVLGPPTELHRVLDAIEAGQDYATPTSGSGSLATDIPEDFLIPDVGAVVTVPTNAHFLFLAAVDAKYQDNFDRDANFGVHISKLTLGTAIQRKAHPGLV